MNDSTGYSLYYVLWAVLLISSLAARRMPLGQTVKMALAWVAIFATAYVLVLFVGGMFA